MDDRFVDVQIHDNPLFAFFLKSKLYSEASERKLVVLVPPTEALQESRIDEEFLRFHVLRPSPYFKDELLTLHGQTVLVDDQQVIRSKDPAFTSTRPIPVFQEEDFYDDNYDKFTVLRIALPLVGHAPADYRKRLTVMYASVVPVPLARRTLEDHQLVIRKVTGSQGWKALSSQCEQFIDQFVNCYVIEPGYLQNTSRLIRRVCTKIRKQALDRLPDRARARIPTRSKALEEFQLAIESMVLSYVHKTLFNGILSLCKSEDAYVDAMCLQITRCKVSMTDVGIRQEIQVYPKTAIDTLAHLNGFLTPMEKMFCLQRVSTMIAEAVDSRYNRKSRSAVRHRSHTVGSHHGVRHIDEDHSPNLGSMSNMGAMLGTIDIEEEDLFAPVTLDEVSQQREGKNTSEDDVDLVLTADDMLPYWVFVISQAQCRFLHSNLKYMRNFAFDQEYIKRMQSGDEDAEQKRDVAFEPAPDLSSLAVHLANFQGALSHIERGRVLKPEQLQNFWQSRAVGRILSKHPRRVELTETDKEREERLARERDAQKNREFLQQKQAEQIARQTRAVRRQSLMGPTPAPRTYPQPQAQQPSQPQQTKPPVQSQHPHPNKRRQSAMVISTNPFSSQQPSALSQMLKKDSSVPKVSFPKTQPKRRQSAFAAPTRPRASKPPQSSPDGGDNMGDVDFDSLMASAQDIISGGGKKK